MAMASTDLDRLWAKVERARDVSCCWPWTGAQRVSPSSTTCSIKWRGRVANAHRVMYEVWYGAEPPPELFVCHHCDNRLCMNPHHLFLATPKENTADMMRKGRHRPPCGARNGRGNARLSWALVSQMRALGEALPPRALSERFGVSAESVRRVLSGRTWPEADRPVSEGRER